TDLTTGCPLMKTTPTTWRSSPETSTACSPTRTRTDGSFAICRSFTASITIGFHFSSPTHEGFGSALCACSAVISSTATMPSWRSTRSILLVAMAVDLIPGEGATGSARREARFVQNRPERVKPALPYPRRLRLRLATKNFGREFRVPTRHSPLRGSRSTTHRCEIAPFPRTPRISETAHGAEESPPNRYLAPAHAAAFAPLPCVATRDRDTPVGVRRRAATAREDPATCDATFGSRRSDARRYAEDAHGAAAGTRGARCRRTRTP